MRTPIRHSIRPLALRPLALRPLALRRSLSIALLAVVAACDDSVNPVRPDGEGLKADLDAVAGAVMSATSISYGVLGGAMSSALGGGSLLTDESAVAVVLPPQAVGRTFVYDTLSDRYVVSERAGAPPAGVRFVLYGVDPELGSVIRPLVETGWADFSRSVTDGNESVRVEAYASGNPPVKVLDYSAGLRGPALLQTLALTGWMRNAADSLTFALTTRFDLASEGVVLDWRTALPARGILSRMKTTFSFARDAELRLDGSIRSRSGELGLGGVLSPATGGTLLATVNGNPFAKLALAGLGSIDDFGELGDRNVTFTRPDGGAVSPEAQQLLGTMLGWFAGGFGLLVGLLAPMETLLAAPGLAM